MSKRRKPYWSTWSSDDPHPRPDRRWRDDPQPRSACRKDVFKWLMDHESSHVNGKLIHTQAARGTYLWQERSRGQDQAYFVVKLKGSNLVVTRTRYCQDGKGANLFFMSLVGDGGKPVTTVSDVVLRHPIKDWQNFGAVYEAAAPELVAVEDWH